MIQIQNIPLPIGGGEEQLRKRAMIRASLSTSTWTVQT